MKRGKYILSMLLALALVLGFCACGGSQAPAATQVPAEAPVQDAEEAAPALERVPFESITVFDDDVLRLEAVEFEDAESKNEAIKIGLDVEFSLEEDYDCDVTAYAAVNGVQVLIADEQPSVFARGISGITFCPYMENANGKHDIYLNCSQLYLNDITEHTEIALTFEARYLNPDTGYKTETKTVNIYPYGAEAAQSFERESKAKDVPLLDNEYVTVIATDWGYGLTDYDFPEDFVTVFFIKNKTDRDLVFYCGYDSINGNSSVTVEQSGGSVLYSGVEGTVLPGACSFVTTSIYNIEEYFPIQEGQAGEKFSFDLCWQFRDPNYDFEAEEVTSLRLPIPAAGQDNLLSQEIVALDHEAIKVTINAYSENPDKSAVQLNLGLENKSEEEVTVCVNGAINGVSVPTETHAPMAGIIVSSDNAYLDIAPGEKKEEKVFLYCESLQQNGITEYGDVGLRFEVTGETREVIRDGRTVYDTPVITDETTHFYPYGKELAENFKREKQASDMVIVEDENCTILVAEYGYDVKNPSAVEVGNYTVRLYIENKTAEAMIFNLYYTTLNGEDFLDEGTYGSSQANGPICIILGEGSRFVSAVVGSPAVYGLEENRASNIQELGLHLQLRSDNRDSWGTYVIEDIVLK